VSPPEAFTVMHSFRNNVDLDELVGKNQDVHRVYSSETSLNGDDVLRPCKTEDDPPPSPIAAADAIPGRLGMHVSSVRIQSLVNDHPSFHVGQSFKHPQCPRCNPPMVQVKTVETPSSKK
jgi:hypothetical protein